MYSAASITFLGISLTVFLRDVVERKIPGRSAAVGMTRKVASAASRRSLRRYFRRLRGREDGFRLQGASLATGTGLAHRGFFVEAPWSGSQSSSAARARAATAKPWRAGFTT